jgi:GMP synthase-like glutamine amidotransferase
MNIFLVDNGSSFTPYLKELLSEFGIVSVHAYDELASEALESQDLLVLTGGHGLPVLWHEKEYHNEAKLIKNHKGPIIGICLGFELIAHLYGAHLHFLDERHKGEVKIQLTPEGEHLSDSKELTVFESHHWSVRELEKPLVSLATSKDGVEIFKHKDKPIYGLQFHPDAGRQDDGASILLRVITSILP